jgi:GNAT superfamily N-acetyltransferase
MKWEMHDRPGSEEAKAIQEGLTEYNARFFAYNHRDLTLSMRDGEGRIVGGLVGFTNWGWLYVRLLWVSDELRSQGWGGRLLAAAEEEACRRGCRGSWLDTFSFQARAFYERQGYRVFGELEQFPQGHTRFYMTKKLQDS